MMLLQKYYPSICDEGQKEWADFFSHKYIFFISTLADNRIIL